MDKEQFRKQFSNNSDEAVKKLKSAKPNSLEEYSRNIQEKLVKSLCDMGPYQTKKTNSKKKGRSKKS